MIRTLLVEVPVHETIHNHLPIVCIHVACCIWPSSTNGRITRTSATDLNSVYIATESVS